MKPISILLSFVALLSFYAVKSQNVGDSTQSSLGKNIIHVSDSVDLQVETVPPKKSYFQLGLNYISNNVNLGRFDSATVNYYTPSFGYYHKSGLYIQATAGFLINPYESRMDMFTLEGGYVFTKGNYDGELVASKYYYSNLSTNVSSEMKGSFSYTNGYDFGFIKPSFMAAANISSEIDYAMALGLEHTFEIVNDVFEVDPKFIVNGSTQNFYSDYFRRRRYSIKRKGKAPLVGVAQITGNIENPNTFKVLDYEASMEINYTVGRFVFTALPTYAIPVNPSVLDISKVFSNGTVKNSKITETIGNVLYWNLGVMMRLGKLQ